MGVADLTPEREAVAETAEARLTESLSRAWWPVARLADLGAPVGATLLGRRLTVFATEDGTPCVTDEACPHRGAALTQGTVVGSSIQCPYHGWQWDGASGACRRIPALGPDGAIPPAARLRTYPAVAYMGIVWTCLSDEPLDSFPPQNAPVETAYTDIATGAVEFETNILVSIENFRDVAHLFFVHRDSIGPTSPEVERLAPGRDGRMIHLERIVELEGADGFYFDSTTTMRYRAFVPHCASVTMSVGETDNASTLFSFVSPTSLATTKVFVVAAIRAGFSETAEGMLAKEMNIFAEDKVILDHVQPASLAEELDQVHSVADAYSLAYRRAFFDWIREAEEAAR